MVETKVRYWCFDPKTVGGKSAFQSIANGLGFSSRVAHSFGHFVVPVCDP